MVVEYYTVVDNISAGALKSSICDLCLMICKPMNESISQFILVALFNIHDCFRGCTVSLSQLSLLRWFVHTLGRHRLSITVVYFERGYFQPADLFVRW